MPKIPAVILIAIVCAIVQMAFIFSLPGAVSAIMLAPAAVVWMIVAFRFREAIIFAVAYGIVVDLLHPFPFGGATAAALASTLILIAIFTRVFSNLSPWIFALMQAAGWTIFLITGEAVNAGERIFSGVDAPTTPPGGLIRFVIAITAQLVFTGIISFVAHRWRQTLAHRFMIARQ